VEKAMSGRDPIASRESERLIFSGYGVDDFADSAAVWADPLITRYIGGTPLDEEDAWRPIAPADDTRGAPQSRGQRPRCSGRQYRGSNTNGEHALMRTRSPHRGSYRYHRLRAALPNLVR
jgi:hypothetical protein